MQMHRWKMTARGNRQLGAKSHEAEVRPGGRISPPRTGTPRASAYWVDAEGVRHRIEGTEIFVKIGGASLVVALPGSDAVILPGAMRITARRHILKVGPGDAGAVYVGPLRPMEE